MSFLSVPASQPSPSARPARGGREAPAPWGGGTGAERGLAARWVGAGRKPAPDLIRGPAAVVAPLAARPRLGGRGGAAS